MSNSKQPTKGGLLEPDLSSALGVPPWVKSLPPHATDEQVMDAYRQHVQESKSLSTGLPNASIDDADLEAGIGSMEEALMRAIAEDPENAAQLMQSYAMMAAMAKNGDANGGSSDAVGKPGAAEGIKLPSSSNASSNATSPSMMAIVPQPGLVFKTHLGEAKEDWPAGLKVFINLCYSNDIPAPPTDDYDEVARAVKEGDNTTFKVPLSLAGPHPDRDKSGKVCLVFEALVNTRPFEMAQENRYFRDFMARLCFEWIGEKHQIVFAPEYTIPKIKVKGTLSTHYIRRTSKTLIKEMSKTVETDVGISKPKKATPAPENVTPATMLGAPESETRKLVPSYDMFAEPAAAKIPEMIVVRVNLPKLSSTESLAKLEVEQRKLILAAEDDPARMKKSTSLEYPYSMLEVDLPHPVDVDQVGARFDRSKRVLTVILYVDEDAAKMA
ncbi:PIH1 domain-containing protein 1 [Blyttiomyces sp. JEL0837]|nr:PIH1 domain-containing protein 1 [Blyttiomyces sp. JEL0837]